MRSTCFRLNVGAIVTRDNNPVAVGWNGQLPGAPHCAGNSCPGVQPGKCNTIHAEVNAIRKAASILEHGNMVDLYVTHSPCSACLDEIMYGPLYIARIFFEIPYRNVSHLDSLRDGYYEMEHGIRLKRSTEVYEVTPAGYTVEYFTRKVVELH